MIPNPPAVAALIGLGAKLPANAVYPSAFSTARESHLTVPIDPCCPSTRDRSRRCTHSGQTTYNPAPFFAANQLNRLAVSSRMPFKRNADGSLEI